MRSLIKTIGPAPSELSEQAFFALLSKERSRVSEGLTEFKLQPTKRTKSGKKKTSRKASAKKFVEQHASLFDTLAEMGLSIDELTAETERRKKND